MFIQNVSTYEFTWYHNTEERHRPHCCDNLKSRTIIIIASMSITTFSLDDGDSMIL